MPLSSIADGCVHNLGRSSANVGFTMGLILPYLGRRFVALHNLLRVRIVYQACGKFIGRADDLLRVRILLLLDAM